MKLYCATGNPGKLREFQLAGELLRIDIEPLAGLKEITAPEENGATFEENARIKAAYYSRFAPGPLFADDSGPCGRCAERRTGCLFGALRGAPRDRSRKQRASASAAGRAVRSQRAICLRDCAGRSGRSSCRHFVAKWKAKSFAQRAGREALATILCSTTRHLAAHSARWMGERKFA